MQTKSVATAQLQLLQQPRQSVKHSSSPMPFTTTCGNGLLAKLPSLCACPAVIVTMQDLWDGVPLLKETFKDMQQMSSHKAPHP
jgi:hypothetical protein